MKKRLDKIQDQLNFEKLKSNKNAIVFLVCMAIATALWFLNALSKDYSTTISFPVKYVNAPNQKFLANEPPSKLDLKVDAHGFTLLRYKLNFNLSPVVLSLTTLTNGLTPQNRTYEIVSSRHLKRISSQISNEIKVREVQPELIYIVLDSLKTKNVAVKAAVDLSFQPQFNLKNPLKIKPATVSITGPAAIIDTIKFLYTEYEAFETLNASVEKELNLVHPEKTTIIPEQVLLEIDVEKFTEKELKVPITILNKPSDVNLKLFPSEVKLRCLVGLSEFDNIVPANFSAWVDFETINTNSTNLAVTIDHNLSFIEVRRFSPESVEYLIENY